MAHLLQSLASAGRRNPDRIRRLRPLLVQRPRSRKQGAAAMAYSDSKTTRASSQFTSESQAASLGQTVNGTWPYREAEIVYFERSRRWSVQLEPQKPTRWLIDTGSFTRFRRSMHRLDAAK